MFGGIISDFISQMGCKFLGHFLNPKIIEQKMYGWYGWSNHTTLVLQDFLMGPSVVP